MAPKDKLTTLDGRRRRELSGEDLERMMLPALFWGTTFDAVLPKESEHREIVGRFLSKIVEMVESGYGLYFYGDNDVGKSALASLLLKEARRWGFSGLFLRTERLRSARIEDERFDDATTVYRRAQSVDVLVLDDFGKEFRGDKSAFTDRLLEDVIRERITQVRTLIITSNLHKDKIVTVYPQSIGRVMKTSILPVPVCGHNYREAEARDLKRILTT